MSKYRIKTEGTVIVPAWGSASAKAGDAIQVKQKGNVKTVHIIGWSSDKPNKVLVIPEYGIKDKKPKQYWMSIFKVHCLIN